MLYREIMAVCSQIHTKHINTLCGQNVELLNVKLAVHMVTTGPYIVLRSELHQFSNIDAHRTNRGRQIAMHTALCTVAHNICGCAVRKLLPAIFLGGWERMGGGLLRSCLTKP